MDIKKLVLFGGLIVLVICAVLYFKGMDKRAFERTSCERVEMLFDNLKFDDTDHEGVAGGIWFKGTPNPLNDSGLLDVFYRFLREGGLWLGEVKTYEFVSSELVNGEDVVNRYVEVRCKVNGKDKVVIVKQRLPLTWGQ